MTTWANIQKAVGPSGVLEINPEQGYKLKTIVRPKKEKIAVATPRSVPLKARKPYKYWDDVPVAEGDMGRVAWSPNGSTSHVSVLRWRGL